MGPGSIYDEDDSGGTKHRTDEGSGEPSGYDRPSKRSHRRRNSSERHSGRDRPTESSRDRHRYKRRSRSPRPSRQSSRDRGGDSRRRRRDSRSPASTDSRRRRRSRSRSAEAHSSDMAGHKVSKRHRHSSPGKTHREDSQPLVRRSGPLPSQADSFAVSNGEEPEKPKEKPNFGNTGALAAASNSVTQADGTTITLKYHEPPEARKPPARDQWKLFVFKGNDVVDTIELGARSCWLVGRESAVVDMAAEHPSISKQHAVIQFRYTEKRNEFGDKIGRVKPYLIDLESANGTELNGDKVPDRRYLELRPKDVVKFGLSTREYVIMLSRD
ncbi:hypothetical protein KVR01_012444 [Diaporthe batatas]|uniref:uncharacterized protein n=1 Tax=Diaporthe batatas TaxID=748121 RepID=UPI001D04477C|nr:uncharacterized protein KVR01_012444 [Diaporthe batatas]KAG8157782.1 hypothetical protein KVR01_012444 [Diaporthe batatas]